MTGIGTEARASLMRWRAGLTAVVLATALLSLVAPASARASDASPCGGRSTRTVGTTITTQFCPLYAPARLGYVPVVSFASCRS